jgi:alkanesulfonate monooxygenase SsuD/methylene tetrahydromethanopterin reductase-like flavin-dependent oxidoreductase (luciferase family)
MDEQFDVMRTLWTQPLVTYHGKWHRIENSGINPLPVQRPIPLWIGGTADSVLRRTARIADGWIVATDAGVPPTPDNYRDNWNKVRAYAAEAGRDPATLGLHTGVGTPSDAQDWERHLGELRALGVTHLSISTRQLPNEPARHLDEIRRVKERIDAVGVNG